jgi:hypothetical protein
MHSPPRNPPCKPSLRRKALFSIRWTSSKLRIHRGKVACKVARSLALLVGSWPLKEGRIISQDDVLQRKNLTRNFASNLKYSDMQNVLRCGLSRILSMHSSVIFHSTTTRKLITPFSCLLLHVCTYLHNALGYALCTCSMYHLPHERRTPIYWACVKSWPCMHRDFGFQPCTLPK